MRDDKLSVQSMDFAVSIINLVKERKRKKETIISNQINRSGTSIGANFREAQYTHGKADFVSNFRSPSKKPMKRDTGLNFYIKQITSTKQDIKNLIPLVQVFV